MGLWPQQPADPPGEVRYRENPTGRWTIALGPVLVLAVVIVDFAGGKGANFIIVGIFGLIILLFSLVQAKAAATHVSLVLTDRALRQGTEVVTLTTIAEVLPANSGQQTQDWEIAKPLGELSGVPRKRYGIGLRMADDTLRQAWARHEGPFRSELTLAVHEAAFAAAAGNNDDDSTREERDD